ncbi:MAG: hypothetical protein KAR21_22635, partial [Spirochaetales bacterium]|nr:hypothetical protein [Spirochaetales bacterium]
MADEIVEAVLTISSGKRLVSPLEFESTKEEVIRFSKENPILIVFDHIGEKLFAEGDYRGSIDYLKAISNREPEKEIHLIRLAEALLKAGLGLDARLAAERAVELNSESARTFSKLAWILQHDELGVRFGPGYDRDGAIAAYNKAIEFDTEEWSNYANLAILLEYDDNGLRYSNGDLREAIETYKKIGDELGDKGMDINVITNLLYLKDWEELETSLGKLENQKTVTLYKVAAYAAAGDFDEAFGEAAKTGNAVDKRRILSGAGELLIYIRNYKSAAVLLKEAAKGSSDAMSLESRAGVLSETVPFEEIVYNSEDPEALVKRFYKALYISNGSDFSKLEDIVTDDLYERAMDRDNNNNFHSEWWSLRNESIRAGMSLEVILDLMLSDIKFQTRKDADGGYHLKLIQTGLGANLDSNFYIRKIDGDLRIAATDSFRAPVGKVILEYMDSGKLESASDWLDWFLKDYSSFAREGDEPLYGHPLQGSWKKRANDKSDIKAMKLAASAILVTDEMLYSEAVTILESGLLDHDSNFPPGKLYYALYFAYQVGDDFEGQYRSASWLY